jgi:DNA-binding XRE family transcriptional regulator
MIAAEHTPARAPRPTRTAAPKGSQEAIAARLAREEAAAEPVTVTPAPAALPAPAVTIAQAIGAYVRELRIESELSQDAVAARCGPSIRREHICRLERGLHEPSLEVVARVAAALDLHPVDLVVCLDTEFRVARNLPGLRA